MVRWILRVGELTLKSKPVRRMFNQALKREVEDLLVEHALSGSLEPWHGRWLLTTQDDASAAVARAFGIVRADAAEQLPLDPEAVAAAALWLDPAEGTRFAVRARRSGERRGWSSQEMAATVGHHVLEARPDLVVDLSTPEWTIDLLMVPDGCWWQHRRIAGPGGLPIGVQGAVLGVLGTFEDLARAWLVSRRGCRVWLEGSPSAEWLDALRAWDPSLALAEAARRALPSGPGRGEQRAWAHLPGVDPPEPQPGDAPLARLDPLDGWPGEEVEQLVAHITDPLAHPWRAGDLHRPMSAWIG